MSNYAELNRAIDGLLGTLQAISKPAPKQPEPAEPLEKAADRQFSIGQVPQVVAESYSVDVAKKLRAVFKDAEKEAIRIVGASKSIEQMTRDLTALFGDGDFDHLKKAKAKEVSSKRYGSIIKVILKENNRKIASSILEADRDRFLAGLSKVRIKSPDDHARIVPDVKHALKRSSSIIKAADRGKLISQTRREEIRKVIKGVLSKEPVETRSGEVRLDIQVKVKKALKEYFEGYTKNSPPYGVPRNLEAIATTETKFLINNVRREYMSMAAENLPKGLKMFKEWRQNRSLSRVPRASHSAMHGVRVPLSKNFRLVEGKKTFYCSGPHDSALPAESIIDCHCDLIYTVALA